MNPVPLTDAQLTSLRTVYDALQSLLARNRTMHLPVAMTFLQIAADEGLTVGEVAQRQGASAVTTSVLISDLSKSHRYRDGGLGLVGKRVVLGNRRKRSVTLSATGAELRSELAALVCKKSEAP
jgi:DNA-binding MarR family transcriptional regulator